MSIVLFYWFGSKWQGNFFIKRDISAFSKLQLLFQDHRATAVDAVPWFYSAETGAVITVAQVAAAQSLRNVCIRQSVI